MRRGDGLLYDLTGAWPQGELPDVLAAIALVQLDKLEAHSVIWRTAARCSMMRLAGIDGVTPLERDPRDTHDGTSTSCASTRSASA